MTRRSSGRVRRRIGSSKDGVISWELSIPAPIGRVLAEAGIEFFDCEMVEDGILYRPVTVAPNLGEADLPDWARGSK